MSMAGLVNNLDYLLYLQDRSVEGNFEVALMT